MRRKLKQTKDGYNLMESEIRDAMKHTQSNMAAAKYLNVNYYTYRKYARMYSDPDGRNLFDVHKNQEGRGLKYKSRKGYKTKYPIEEVILGMHPEHPPAKLKVRLFQNGYKQEECECCGFDERRFTDYTVPLLLDWIDGDKSNHQLENIRVLCYNCYYLQVGSPCNTRIGTKNYRENGGF